VLSGEGRAGRAQWVNLGLWFVLEVAIAATDLAEVIGSATAIYLLSNGAVPLWAGVLITAVDVLVVLLLGTRNFRVLELLVGSLILLIAGIFACGPLRARPREPPMLAGVTPVGRTFLPVELKGKRCRAWGMMTDVQGTEVRVCMHCPGLLHRTRACARALREAARAAMRCAGQGAAADLKRMCRGPLASHHVGPLASQLRLPRRPHQVVAGVAQV